MMPPSINAVRTLLRQPIVLLPPTPILQHQLARSSLRFFNSSSNKAPRSLRDRTTQYFRSSIRNASRTGKQTKGRRFASTAPATAEAQSLLRRLWDSPIGVKTVHFWAPVMKWAIVLAGISDLARPAEKLSLTQNLALTATGLIWTRWCLIIKPRNVLLATVNFFLGIVGIAQVTRILRYRRSEEGKSAQQQIKELAVDVKEDVQGAVRK